MTNHQEYLTETDVMDTLTFEGLDKKYTYVMMLTTSFYYLLALLLPLFIYVFGDSDATLTDACLLLGAVAALIIIGVINVLIMVRAFRYRGYAIREKDITYRRGLIFHNMVTVPFCKVQQVTISQGPVERFFGLFSVDITNGAQMLSSLSIRGLSKTTAESLKQHIINKLNDAAE